VLCCPEGVSEPSSQVNVSLDLELLRGASWTDLLRLGPKVRTGLGIGSMSYVILAKESLSGILMAVKVYDKRKVSSPHPAPRLAPSGLLDAPCSIALRAESEPRNRIAEGCSSLADVWWELDCQWLVTAWQVLVLCQLENLLAEKQALSRGGFGTDGHITHPFIVSLPPLFLPRDRRRADSIVDVC
jgi:hypothetical protein